MLIKKNLYLLLSVILIGNSLLGQQYNFKNYSAENGLPFVQISCMTLDINGYLWCGGYGGLSRFDGNNFLNFGSKNGLVNQYVNAICADDTGAIYVGSAEGLSIYDKGKIFNYTSSHLKSDYINALCHDKSNGIYIGTRSGLYLLYKSKFTEIQKFNQKEIKSILKTSTGLICIGTTNGLYYYNPIDKSAIKQNDLAGENINCLAECPETKHILVGTSTGLSKIELVLEKPQNLHIENGLIDENITAIFCEDQSNIWVGSASGLLKFNGKSFDYYNLYSENNANHIRSLLKDNESNIWVGTHSGIYKYRDNAFYTFDRNTGISNAFVFQILKDKDSNIWFCTDGNGVYKYAQGFFKNYTSKDGLLNNSCVSASIQDDGSIWFGTNSGISIFKNNTFSPYSGNNNIKVKGTLSVQYRDKKNALWIGGQNGVEKIVKEKGIYTHRFYKIPESLKESGVQAIVEDNEENIWLGTFLGGLFKLEGEEFVNQNDKLNIKATSFFMLLCDKNNVMYGATLNGLWIFDQKNNTQNYITTKDGLNSELIYLLHFSENENLLWIGTNQGVNKLNLSEYRKSKTLSIESYGKVDGFTGSECNNYGVFEEKDGTLWFGTVSGVVVHKPSSIKKNKHLPPTYIQNIKVMNEDSILAPHSQLPYNINTLSFYYRGICFTNPEKVMYKKKLEGYDSKWSEPSSEDYTKYPNLPAGKYIFKVISCNNEGIWNETPAEFPFEIKLPFYKTWWFLVIVLVGLITSIITIFKLRIQNIRKKQRLEFEKKVEISKIELKALRSQMNPHFVFNSLNSIQHYILNSNPNEAARYLNKFAKLIRVILNNSEKQIVTINEDIESVRLYLELEQMRFDGKFDYSITIDSSIDGDYDAIPPMLIQPFIENAVLHGLNPKLNKGHVKIDIFTKENYIVCRITDNGIGRDKSREIKKTQPGQKHKSLGMKITIERLRVLNDIHKSDLSVVVTDLKDEKGNATGTMVELFIPHLN